MTATKELRWDGEQMGENTIGFQYWNFKTKKLMSADWQFALGNSGKDGIPILPIVTALQKHATAPHDKISVTGTTWCRRQAVLKQKVKHYESLESLLTTWKGVLVHKALEEEAKNFPEEYYISEVHMLEKYTIDGEEVEFGGTCDLLEKLPDGTYCLHDYKTNRGSAVYQATKAPLLQGHVAQGNCYAFGLRNQYQISKIIFHSICDYHGIASKEIPLWPHEATHDYIIKAIKNLKDAMNGNPLTVTEARKQAGQGEGMCKGFYPKCAACKATMPQPNFPPIPCPFWVGKCQLDYEEEMANKSNNGKYVVE